VNTLARGIQALLLVAAIACGITAVAYVGSVSYDTESACHIYDAPQGQPPVTDGCAIVPAFQVQTSVGMTFALTAVAMMVGAVAMNGLVRPAGSAPTVQSNNPGPYPPQPAPYPGPGRRSAY
jgi:hypothetical protein